MIGFHELYERHAGDVYRFALFLTGNAALADDLVSETFVRAWNARGTIREPIIAAAFALTGVACWVTAYVINRRARAV